MKNIYKHSILWLSSFILLSCGGGKDEKPTDLNPPVPPVVIEKEYAVLVQSDSSVIINATIHLSSSNNQVILDDISTNEQGFALIKESVFNDSLATLNLTDKDIITVVVSGGKSIHIDSSIFSWPMSQHLMLTTNVSKLKATDANNPLFITPLSSVVTKIISQSFNSEITNENYDGLFGVVYRSLGGIDVNGDENIDYLDVYQYDYLVFDSKAEQRIENSGFVGIISENYPITNSKSVSIQGKNVSYQNIGDSSEPIGSIMSDIILAEAEISEIENSSDLTLNIKHIINDCYWYQGQKITNSQTLEVSSSTEIAVTTCLAESTEEAKQVMYTSNIGFSTEIYSTEKALIRFDMPKTFDENIKEIVKVEQEIKHLKDVLNTLHGDIFD